MTPAQQKSVLIIPLIEARLDGFFAYLSEHLAENGSETSGYFQPQPRALSGFPADREVSFRKALCTPLSAEGWRRAWIAVDDDESIMGHVDLRAHRDPSTSHRCLLGMGVHHAHRKRGVGMALLQHAKEWAETTHTLSWIDLQVLTTNRAAIQLYTKAGYVQTGLVPDMFRIDGNSIGDLWMALRLAADC